MPRSRSPWLLLASALALTGPVAATGAQSAGARIVGTVHDSLFSRGPLGGADVVVSGTTLSAVTDERGRFTVTGVPPGRYPISFFHPSLDSLGLSAPIVEVTVPETGEVSLRLSTPSAETVLSALCPGPRGESTGLLLGRVRDVDTGAPVAGALVSAQWPEWVLGSGGFQRTDAGVRRPAEADGSFRLCGVAADAPVVVRAEAAGRGTGLVEVAFANRPIASVDLDISFSDSATRVTGGDPVLVVDSAAIALGSSRVSGAVRDQDGRALAGALVSLVGSVSNTRTTVDGSYQLSGVPAGAQTVEVRALGFAPVRRRVTVRSGGSASLDVVLDRNAQTLAPLHIVGAPSGRVDLSEFEQRRKTNAFGSFLTREQIDRRNAIDVSELLVGLPGVTTVWAGSRRVIAMTRAGDRCLPNFYLDGVRVQAGDAASIDQLVLPHHLRGIEVYRGLGGVPPQYAGLDSECGVVLLWTRR